MPSLVKLSVNPPHFKVGVLADFETKVPSRSRRIEISTVFMDGTALLDPRETPAHLALANAHRIVLRDMLRSEAGVCVVSGALRDLLQELDPGLHQFLPLTLDGSPQPGERYILNVHFKQDSLVVEQTKALRFSGDRSQSLFRLSAFVKDGDTVLDTRRLGQVHAWREQQLRGSLLISDVLRDEIRRRKLKICPLVKCTSIAATIH